MKKLFLIITILLLLGQYVNANEEITLTGSINFDWLTKSQLERDTNISEIQKNLYNPSIITKYDKKAFKDEYKDHLKDKNAKEHYKQVLSGIKETKTEKLAGFFINKNRILYMYAIQYKDNPRKVYYYDTLGNLRYIDILSENYPNYPYYSHQYYINGKLISSIYFTAYDTQYMYKDNKFIGVWFKDAMFNSKAKKIMTRTNY